MDGWSFLFRKDIKMMVYLSFFGWGMLLFICVGDGRSIGGIDVISFGYYIFFAGVFYKKFWKREVLVIKG